MGWKAARAYQNQKLSIGPEMEQAFRRRAMAPWAKYNDFLFRDYDPKTGDVSIQDVGYSNPFGEITSLMEAAFFEPGTVGEKASRVAEQLEDVFLGKEIFLWAGLETAMNVQTEGSNVIEALTDAGTKRPITHEYQTDALMERMYYFFKKTGPGVFVEPERVFEEAGAGRFYGLLPEKDKTIDSTVMQEVLSIFGMPRVASYNIGDSLGYHYTDASFRKRALSYAVGKSIRAGRFEGDLPKFEEAWTEIQAQVHELVDDSWKLKQSGKSIQTHLKGAGFNDSLTKAMMHGQFVPLGAAINLENR